MTFKLNSIVDLVGSLQTIAYQGCLAAYTIGFEKVFSLINQHTHHVIAEWIENALYSLMAYEPLDSLFSHSELLWHDDLHLI